MTTVFRSEEFEQLLEDGTLDDLLDDFELDFGDLLMPFNPIALLLGGGPDLWVDSISPTRIDMTAEPFFGFATTPEGFYTVTIHGAGFSPVGDPEAFEDALDEYEASGRIDRITIDFEPMEHGGEDDGTAPDDGPIRIMDMTITPGAYTLTSGNQALEITGTLPNTFEQMNDFLMGLEALFELDDEDEDATPDFSIIDTLLEPYSFSSLTLFDDGEEVLAVQMIPEGLEISAGGYRIVFCDFSLNFEALFEALGGLGDFEEDEPLWPDVGFYDAEGNPVEMVSELGFLTVGFFEDTTFLNFTPSTDGVGTYYIGVRADADGPLSQGFYQVAETSRVDFDFPRIEETDGDAPADISTQYTLAPGGDFVGLIDPEGDEDWIRVNFDEAETLYTFRIVGLTDDDMDDGGFDIDLDALFALFGVTCVRVFNPAGELIAEAADPADLFGDPDGPGEPDEPGEPDDDPDLPGPGFPSLPPGPAWGVGDPHLFTLDGVGYDFHAAGEYVMTRATDGSSFEVQARMAPVGENVTANIAAAVQLDGAAVMVDARGPTPLTVNGAATEIEDGAFIQVGGDRIYREGDSYMLVHTRDGDMDTGYSAVQVDIVGDRVDIIVGLEEAWRGNVEGLLGNFDGNPDNDIALADGTVLERPLRFDDVYGSYREDWRVSTEEQSLFTYGAGEGPDSYYLPDYPTSMVTLGDFSDDARAAAAARLEGSGLEPGTLAHDNALLDLLLTDDDSYIVSGRTAQTKVDTRPEESAAPVVPEVDGGGLEGLLVLSGQIADTSGAALNGATVTFQPLGRSVQLTRLTRDSDEFSFDLSEGASGQVNVTREYAGDADASITASDALDVLRLSVGLSPSFGPAAAQNYVAADINGDGRVGADDALEVLRHAVGLESDHVPRWVFV
ncbi:MAG: VWD domain-containing protein, partial [Pararhodobacter sp.]|nr:VWD domain-containing protein [Pararhodobacter sp.]